MSLSAKDALFLARTNSDAAQEDQRADSAIRHYQIAKSALAIADALKTVNAVKTANASLEATIAAHQDGTTASEKSDGGLKRKAFKCRERANTLRQKLDGRVKASAVTVVPTFGGPLPLPALAMATAQTKVDRLKSLPGVSSLSCCTAPTTAFVNTSSATSVNTSPATAGNITSATRQRATPTPQAVALALAATGNQGSQSLFSKDVSPVPYISQLPGPNAELQTTCQLAYCLALLHASVHENDLSPDALKWRHNTLSNLHEKNRLENLAVLIIKAFAEDAMKDTAAVTEVVKLAPVLSNGHSRFLLKTFFDIVNQSEMPDLHSMNGLAKVIQGAAPGFVIDSNDLVIILRSLHKRLQITHSDHSESHRYHVLLVVSRVLDAMVDAKVGEVDRSSLHGPLTDLLRELESSKNPYVTFQAEYATQALLNVSSNENIWQAGFRRVWLVLKGGAGFAKMPDPSEIKNALEGLETTYVIVKEGARTLKNALMAIRTRECPTFTVKDGLKFRKAWYSALRIAESHIQAGKLVHFKTLLITLSKSCRRHPMFQWGICQLLGQFATNAQWDLEARKNAIAFLGELYRADRIWLRQKETDQVIFDVLTKVVSNDGPRFEIARTLLEEIRQQNTQSWNSIPPSDLSVHDATSNVTLLQLVQNRLLRHAKLENLPDHPPQPKLEDIQLALKTYYAPELHILRVSGEPLDLETCFVNLAIVEAPAQREKETQFLKEQAAVFHRIPSFERLEHTNTLSPIPMEQLFDKRKLCDGKESHPRIILVQGRAGIGKTTLSKMIVHAHQNGLWSDRFDTVLWLPLRHLNAIKARNLEGLFREKFFTQDLDEDGAALARALVVSAKQGRVLFILDGLDEIAKDTQCDDGHALKLFLKTLLAQKHVIITSRPSGVDRSLLPTVDLELETIGFSQQNVADYLVKVLEPEQARTVQDFIRQTPLMQGLVNIPVQLDVICFSWDSLPTDGPAITMTGLYQLIVRKLWCKDALRLTKSAGGMTLTQEHVSQLEPQEVDELMVAEIQHLGYLAFKGLTNDHQIEFDENALLDAFRDLQKDRATVYNCQLLPPQMLEMMKQTSFLHSADARLDSEHSYSRQTWHFLHLTFQEYFAATWITRHLQVNPTQSTVGMMTMEQMESFIQEQKYNPQYEILWWMVAGLLEGEAIGDFFSLLQGEPRDLIGSRHQLILASCLHEARDRLDPMVVSTLDSELLRWLYFEMQVCQYDACSSSMFGSQISFPEALLLETLAALDPVCSWKSALVRTLGARSALSPSAIQSLTVALTDKHMDVRSSAAAALGQKSPLVESAIQSLYVALHNCGENAKFWAASGYSTQLTSVNSAMQSLVSTFKDECGRVSNSAAAEASSPGTLSSEAVLSLLAALNGSDNKVKYSAASTLSTQSTLPETAIDSLIATLQGGSRSVRHVAAQVLSSQFKLPESAIHILIAALNDGDDDVRFSAASALVNQTTLPESIIQSLIATVRGENRLFRFSAASVLSNQSTLPSSAIQSLVAALDDEDEHVRSSGATVLGSQLILPDSAIDSLLAKLHDNSESVRDSAASALAKQSTLSESAIDSVITALKNDNDNVRHSAASVLDGQCALPDSAIQCLIVALNDKNGDVRNSAASALGKQSTLSESAIQSLIAALKDDNGDFSYPVASALVKQCTLPELAIQPFSDALEDGNWQIRSSAALALTKCSKLPESTIESLIARLQDYTESVRISAASVLGDKFKLSDYAIEYLSAALLDNNYDRSLVVSILGKQSTLPESVMLALVAALRDEGDGRDVRRSAAAVLGKQSTLPESVMMHLVDALYDGDDNAIRNFAASVLCSQSMLPETVLRRLIAVLTSVHEDARHCASEVLLNQCASLCTVLPLLSEYDVAYLYRNHLFRYSCRRVVSLQIQGDRLYMYTEQGLVRSEPISARQVSIIEFAFNAIQRKEGILV